MRISAPEKGPFLQWQLRIVLRELFQPAQKHIAIEVAGQEAEVARGIEQPFRILQREGLHERSEVLAGAVVEEPNQAEIVKADAAIAHDEQIAGVRVAMEHPGGKELLEIGVDESLGQHGTGFLAAGSVDPAAGAHMLHRNPLALHALDRGGHKNEIGRASCRERVCLAV